MSEEVCGECQSMPCNCVGDVQAGSGGMSFAEAVAYYGHHHPKILPFLNRIVALEADNERLKTAVLSILPATCDWGYCDGETVDVRRNDDDHDGVWLAVCAEHAELAKPRDGGHSGE